MADLPYVDEHALVVGAPRPVVWEALERHVADSVLLPPGHPLGRVLGVEPAEGFAVAERVLGRRLELRGRHRFSRYRLAFVLDDDPAGTRLRAVTHAAFPGPHGLAYRLLVIGSRAHVLATRRMLRGVAREALVRSGTA